MLCLKSLNSLLLGSQFRLPLLEGAFRAFVRSFLSIQLVLEFPSFSLCGAEGGAKSGKLSCESILLNFRVMLGCLKLILELGCLQVAFCQSIVVLCCLSIPFLVYLPKLLDLYSELADIEHRSLVVRALQLLNSRCLESLARLLLPSLF